MDVYEGLAPLDAGKFFYEFMELPHLVRRDEDLEEDETESYGLKLASSSVNHDSCITCPTSSPSCPSCADDEECVQITQTCTSCPKTYCAKGSSSLGNYTSGSSSSSSSTSSSSSSHMSSAKIGGIAGGVSVGVFLIFGALMFFAWKYYFKNKFFFHREQLYDLDEDEDGNKVGDNAGLLDGTEKRMSQVTVGSKANSVLTKASNIINVAYIPGVTIRKGVSRAPANSIYSRESYFSDLENASIHGASIGENKAADTTTTAIRAVPKLVSVNGLASEEDDGIPMTATSVASLGGVRLTPMNGKASNSRFQPGLQNDYILEDEEEEDDEHDDDHDVFSDQDEQDEDEDDDVSDSASESDSDDSSYLRSSDEEDIDLIAEQHVEKMKNKALSEMGGGSSQFRTLNPSAVGSSGTTIRGFGGSQGSHGVSSNLAQLREGIPIELVVSDEENDKDDDNTNGSFMLTVDFDQGAFQSQSSHNTAAQSPFDDKFRTD
ncbi:unnamed protein product [Kuraishia capsulata CBS 1993]|uniref:Membrane anchor Opy2 N-terminal domain-containing protein n=1 Tax=Kuraishia capsulata CBS 1993 TaxID=1382522 RepID=W6MTQ4_9ASCO|nr:uncharacterized protein KUCA_T00004586001 [Kuraishia capsulata CBS 1993]CDK28602.1 unnamed protein product [Kuraishia capsulata CBS 1993]